jgi:hypothetical protein
MYRVNEVPARAGSGVSAEAPPATANRRVPPRVAVPVLLAADVLLLLLPHAARIGDATAAAARPVPTRPRNCLRLG